jgi:dephospho-CoA kinase
MTAEGNTRNPLRLVVTGGIGSGKSTVTEMMRHLGALVIDSDRIGHAVLEPGGAAYDAVAARWPMVVIDGRIDRGALAAIVFSDGGQLAELEQLTHPHIAAEIKRRVAAASGRDIVVELPVDADLVGPGWKRVVVDAPDAIRLHRSVRRGIGERDAANRMNSQPSRREWLAVGDVVLLNDGDLESLRERVRKLWDRLVAEAAGPVDLGTGQ